MSETWLQNRSRRFSDDERTHILFRFLAWSCHHDGSWHSCLYSAGMIFFMFSHKVENLITRTGVIYRFIIWIGSLSFGIYLIHRYFVSFLANRLPTDSWLLQWTLALFLTTVLIQILRKLLPTKYYKSLGI